MKIYTIILLIVTMSLIVFVLLKSELDVQENLNVSSSLNQPYSEQSDTILTIGNPQAPVTIIEYFDYKCPACNNFHRTTGKKIDEKYTKEAMTNYEIRITPIIGPDSATAARGAYCAYEQNVFNLYHNAVLDYMHNKYYSAANFSAEHEMILTSQKLAEINIDFLSDIELFIACTDSERYNPSLQANLEAAADDSVRGTPSFRIGSQSFIGAQPYNVFETLIDIELRN